MKRKIAVFTGTRAEYGLLKPLMTEIRSSATLELQLIVSGAHLTPVHGNTWQQIEQDGFAIDEQVEILLASDSAIGVTKSMGLALIGFAEVLQRLRPDILVVLGDRYEALAIATAAMIARIPIAHIHGGESTEGAIDEAIRHSITKMSHLHFVAAEDYRRRVVQLGEQSDRVWVTGALGVDNIFNLPMLSKLELERLLNIRLISPCYLLTYHPVTLAEQGAHGALDALIGALLERGGTIVVTGVNADPGSAEIREFFAKVASQYPDRVVVTPSLGAVKYLNLMRYVDAVVGNSSSGLLEAPYIGVPTVDVGDRQKGRLRAPSVIHCNAEIADIREALAKAASCEHRTLALNLESPYGRPGASKRIARVLESVSLDGVLKKRFCDLG
ncbi:MAG: UDP-N-acetylglucosamine 2-epimerase [Verrucomicrobiota bacterium]